VEHAAEAAAPIFAGFADGKEGGETKEPADWVFCKVTAGVRADAAVIRFVAGADAAVIRFEAGADAAVLCFGAGADAGVTICLFGAGADAAVICFEAGADAAVICFDFNRQRSLTWSCVRPGNIFAIATHLLPIC
jgi:hypothetical protein